MFSVLFEVNPHHDQWDAYLGSAKMLRPELEQIDGFVDNIRYRSLTRPGWILSLSGWRDEKALVRWRTHARHHDVQVRGRTEILADYHLRVGQVTDDTRTPPGYHLTEQRLDETETGEATTVTLINATWAAELVSSGTAEQSAAALGLDASAPGLMSWDVFDAVLTPGDVILMLSWRALADASAYEGRLPRPANSRRRRIRVIRDYGMYDRRENPQYYPDAPAPGRP
ncbi:MAG: antibiotic biosynthesis monooxygenase family protein [Trebonia sp.]